MTRKDAQKIVDSFLASGTKYKKGYCCFQDDHISRFDMINLGINSGNEGWNFTLYYHKESDTIYCDCYRYAPKDNFN